MASIPRDSHFDDTLALLKGGYNFISSRCRELRSDAFSTRLLLRRVTCVMGEDAARMFYHPDRFTRKKAMPPTTLKLLQDLGSVQLQDGAEHRQRKQMFVKLLAPEHLRRIVDIAGDQWHAAVSRWERKGEIILHDEMREVFCRTICEWAGIRLSNQEARKRTRELGAMIDGAGAVGVKNLHAMVLRRRTEHWAREIIQRVRSHYTGVPEDSPLATIAWHREADGMLLNADVAAVELLNFLRPTVAVARFVVFGALALHEHPEARERLARREDDYSEWFVQEVRRYYPFFPCVGGRVRQPFEWHGEHFDEGDWILLDLYGTNHDERIWDEPQAFRPERFADWNGSPFNFVPQGAGGLKDGHRCPGERLTIDLTKAMLQRSASDIDYEVPKQDLSIDLTRMPAIPASRFVMRNIRRRASTDATEARQMLQ